MPSILQQQASISLKKYLKIADTPTPNDLEIAATKGV